MKRVLLMVIMIVILAIPAGNSFSQDDPWEYKIKSMTENTKWVMIEKRERVGAGTTVYYLNKEKIVSIVLDYPNNVTIQMGEEIEYKMNFISNSTASQFVRDLVGNL
jgi:hypothetical protein